MHLCIDEIRYKSLYRYSYSVKLDKDARWWIVETVLLIRCTRSPVIDVDCAYVTILRRRSVVTDLLVSTAFRQEWRIDVFCRNRRETRIRLYLIYFGNYWDHKSENAIWNYLFLANKCGENVSLKLCNSSLGILSWDLTASKTQMLAMVEMTVFLTVCTC